MRHTTRHASLLLPLLQLLTSCAHAAPASDAGQAEQPVDHGARKRIAPQLTEWQRETLAVKERKVHSQSMQDGVLQALFNFIGTTNKYYVEFGFNANTFNAGSGANTLALHRHGWKGLLMDGSHENPVINLRKEWLGPHSILSLFEKHNVPKEADYVSIDFDSYDLWTFRSIIVNSPWRPRVFTVEYNCAFPPNSTLTLEFPKADGYWPVPPAAGADGLFGTSLGALDLVAKEGGYTLVYVVSGYDAFFVRNDIVKEKGIVAAPYHQLPFERIYDGACLNATDPTSKWPKADMTPAGRLTLGGHPTDAFGFWCTKRPNASSTKDRARVVHMEDYAVYAATGSHKKAHHAARKSSHANYLLDGVMLTPQEVDAAMRFE